MKSFLVAFCVVIAASSAFAETCQKPEVTASAYVTEDATVLTQVAYTTQFTLKCTNGVKGISLYAEVDGKALPAVRLSNDNKYQVHKIIAYYRYMLKIINKRYIMFYVYDVTCYFNKLKNK